MLTDSDINYVLQRLDRITNALEHLTVSLDLLGSVLDPANDDTEELVR